MPLPPLTKRQLDIVDFFRRYVRDHSISPTFEEIAQALGVNRVTIFGHVAELERKGVLRKTAPGISRALRLSPSARAASPPPLPARVSILGIIAAGSPIEAVEVTENLDLGDFLRRSGDVYALRVRGNSMIEDSIRDGDLVLVERRTDVKDGEIIVAVLPDQESATLKRLYRECGRIRLQPANSSMRPLIVDSVEIRGVVLGLFRTY